MIATMYETETETEATTATTPTLFLEDIHFADGDLSRPLYRTLVRYPEVLDPEVQVDLGVQVGTSLEQLEITFELRANLGVEFASESDGSRKVKVRDLSFPDAAPAGVEALLDSPRRCTFIWNRPLERMARVRAFRIYCHKADPSPKEIVYGGLFLALIAQPRFDLGPKAGETKRPPVESLTNLKLIGIDDKGRPLYNIFNDYSELTRRDQDVQKLMFSHFVPVVDPTVIEPPRCMNGICVG